MATNPETQEFLQAITAGSARLADFNQQLYQKISNHDTDGSSALLTNQFVPFANQLQTRADTTANLQKQLMAQEVNNVKAIQAQAIALTIIMLLICAAVGVIVVLIVFGINRSLLATATSLSDGAAQIAAAATQVSSSSQSLAQGATEQAAAIEETSASAEEINSMARNSTDSSRATAALVAESLQRVEMANQNLEDMVVAMNDLSESSGKISKIIRVIDEIAFQTNILALNAAVEAARAGEAGMGFAVVADEVRNLAQRSAQAAKDTAALIEDSIAKSQAGKLKVDQVAAAIRSITAAASKMKILVDEINLGSQEQSKGIDQISRTIHEMEKVTQSTAANAEESAAAAQQLTAQSQSVMEIVHHLNALVGVSASPSNDNSLGSNPHRLATNGAGKPPAFRQALRSMKGAVHLAGLPQLAVRTTVRRPSNVSSFPLDDREFKEF